MTFAASGSRWVVFAASALALVATSALAVLGGEIVARYVSPIWIRRAAGALFIVLGVLFLVGSRTPDVAPEPEADSASASESESEQ